VCAELISTDLAARRSNESRLIAVAEALPTAASWQLGLKRAIDVAGSVAPPARRPQLEFKRE
jgi:hypothetical protein